MALCGFKSKNEVLASPFTFWPQVWRWQNYASMFRDSGFMTALGMTFLGAALFTAGSLVINSMAAYVFARLDFTAKRFWWVVCIMPMFVPSMAILITSFTVVTKLGMLNSLTGLIIPGMASATQMFFMRQFFLAMPMAVEEAAMIDGCSRWSIFTRIFVPNSAAVFTVVGMLSFMAYWNAYIWPVLIVSNPNIRQIMQFLADFRSQGTSGTEWGLLMAGSTIAALPAIILLLIFQRFIVAGVRISGIK
jgi:multiple sugar transport system permease protein